MAGQGFKKIFNLKGGIQAWEGEKATGPIELHLDLIRVEETPLDIIRVAYGMEHTLGHLYTRLQSITGDEALSQLLARLSALEDKHKQYLLDLHAQLEPAQTDREALEASVLSSATEGGFDTEELFQKNREFLKDVPALLDLSMMLETQALDLYLRFARKVEADQAKQVLYRIADEEKTHLTWLGKLRDQRT
jgi:sulfur-carrier protein adenylyltransferase/sulfurtransferase